MEIALALAAAALIVALGAARLGRRSRRHAPFLEPREELAEADPHHRDAEEQALALAEGALDPDELDGDPSAWDEGADDELG